MRPRVGTVTGLFRVALVAAAAACGRLLLPTTAPSGLHGVSWSLYGHVAASYGLTALSFAAFPRARRADVVKSMLAVAVVIELLRHLAGCGGDRLDAVADAAGMIMVLAPSYLERMRSAGRRSAREPYTLAYSNERRGLAPRRGGVTTRLAQVGAYARGRA